VSPANLRPEWITDDPLLAVADLVDRLERGWYAAEAWDGSDTHPYTPYPLPEFLAGLDAAIKAAPGPRYLEVGCGIGSKLVIAANLGLDVTAIESRERYAAVARHLCPAAVIEIADARGWGRYGGFDMIYCYRPIVSEAGEAALEADITAQAKTGSVLFLPDRHVEVTGWRQVAEFVWMKN
jgi:protein-L-isoaspartate O-methyltransferase